MKWKISLKFRGLMCRFGHENFGLRVQGLEFKVQR